MSIYSPERKAALIIRMLPPHSQPVSQLSREEGIPIKTLYHWRSEAGISTPSVSAESTHPRDALLYWLKLRHFLPMLLPNTVAVKACILSKFSSGRMS